MTKIVAAAVGGLHLRSRVRPRVDSWGKSHFAASQPVPERGRGASGDRLVLRRSRDRGGLACGEGGGREDS